MNRIYKDLTLQYHYQIYITIPLPNFELKNIIETVIEIRQAIILRSAQVCRWQILLNGCLSLDYSTK